MMTAVTTVVLAGVGGQGTILAGDVLAKVAMAEGYDVRLSEVHGMAQRGGQWTRWCALVRRCIRRWWTRVEQTT